MPTYYPTTRRASFREAVDQLKGIEGVGWDKKDRGGKTVYGIVVKWHKHKFVPGPIQWSHQGPVAKINGKYRSAKAFYYQEFWKALRCDDHNHLMATQLFFFGVNAGVRQARRELQRAISACRVKLDGRLTIDGRIGPNTRRALAECDPYALQSAFVASIEGFYRAAKQSDRYATGWINKRIYFKRS